MKNNKQGTKITRKASKGKTQTDFVQAVSPDLKQPGEVVPAPLEPAVDQAPDQEMAASRSCDFPIVGLGASAGGLEAFSAFFSALPPNTGMAYVLVQHLDPTHTSSMVDLLKRYTRMPVVEATDTVEIEPDHVYMIPPNKAMTIADCTLRLEEQTEQPGIVHSIDMFFRSMAKDMKDKAICIILSGTGTDGTQGARAIKSALGLVMVQDPETARYDGMPRAAIAAGVADIVVPAEKMGEKLMDYYQQSYGRPAKKRRQEVEKATDSMQRIFTIVRSRTKHDFSGYKPSTIHRRIERRMSVNQIDNIEEYTRLLQESPHEVDSLVKDFLINVTSFFRDAEAYEILKVKIQELLERKVKENDLSFRVWVVGCSTGEEAYSIAIILHEMMDHMQKYVEWQVFATDLDPDAIEIARHGVYPESIKADISPELLKNYFNNKDGQYIISRDIREKVIFSVHDVTTDPPFSRIDLISARNLLIYLNSDMQKKILPFFYYSLNNGGLLFLGSAESVGEFTDYFTTVDRKWRIYQVQKKGAHLLVEIPHNVFIPPTQLTSQGVGVPDVEIREAEKDLLKILPPSVLIDDSGRVLFVHGETWKYLQLAQGKLTTSILEMAREGIRPTLTNIINEVLAKGETVSREGARSKVNGYTLKVKITVKPIASTPRGPRKLAVIFEDIIQQRKRSKKGEITEPDSRVKELEQELQYTRENLRSTVEELETANEELRSANEEYQSTNEELQSTNEELETSREELQSVNEELVTVNSEFQKKIEELSTINDDMQNLLNSTGVATVFLDQKLNIKRYTPAATGILNLIGGDVGRPLSHITTNLRTNSLSEEAQKVLETLVPISREMETKDGRNYSMRIHPYRTTENVIAGVVISFIDINRQKQLEVEQKVLIDSMEKPVVILDSKLKIIMTNEKFNQLFKIKEQQIQGKFLHEFSKDLVIPQIRKIAESTGTGDSQVNDLVIEGHLPDGDRHKLKLNARPLNKASGDERKVFLSIEDLGRSQAV